MFRIFSLILIAAMLFAIAPIEGIAVAERQGAVEILDISTDLFNNRVTVSYTNLNEPNAAIVVMAFYEQEDNSFKLLNARTVSPIPQSQDMVFDIGFPFDMTDAYKIKAILWDIDTIRPLGNYFTVTFEQRPEPPPDGNLLYGYIMGVAVWGPGITFPATAQVRILPQNGPPRDLTLADDIRINGVVVTGAENQLDMLRASAAVLNNDWGAANAGFTQVVRFSTVVRQGMTVIDNIITILDPSGGLTFDARTVGRTFTYTSANMALTADGASFPSIITSGAVVFRVPHNRNEFENYSVTSPPTAFRNNQDGYVIEAFDVSPAGVARVIVLFGGAGDPIRPTTGVIMFDNLVNRSQGGEIVTELRGIYFPNRGGSQNVSLLVGNGVNVNNLRRGDLIRVGMNAMNRINQIEVLSTPATRVGIARTASGTAPGMSNPGIGSFDADFNVIRGSVFAIDRNHNQEVNVIVISANILNPMDTHTVAPQPNLTLTRQSMQNAQFIRLQPGVTPNAQWIISTGNINMIEGLFSYLDLAGWDPSWGEHNIFPSELIVYMSGGIVRLVVVVDR